MSPSVSERRDRDETHSEAHPRQWVSFEHDDDTWMFDATFLMSPYRCIFNDGCKGVLDDGRKVTAAMFRDMLAAEQARLAGELGEAAWRKGNFPRAGELLDEITTSDRFATFLTLSAYRELA